MVKLWLAMVSNVFACMRCLQLPLRMRVQPVMDSCLVSRAKPEGSGWGRMECFLPLDQCAAGRFFGGDAFRAKRPGKILVRKVPSARTYGNDFGRKGPPPEQGPGSFLGRKGSGQTPPGNFLFFSWQGPTHPSRTPFGGG